MKTVRKKKITGLALLTIMLAMPMTISLAKAETWVEVASFQASLAEGYVIPTEFFEITHEEWRVRWKFTGSGILYVEIISLPEWRRGDDARYLDYIYTVKTNGTLYLHENKDRRYRLEATVDYMESPVTVTLIVEQDVDSIPEFTPATLTIVLIAVSIFVVALSKKFRHSQEHRH